MEKTRVLKKTVKLKDGTEKIYESKATYKVKGHILNDGTVSKFSDEQQAEIKRLRRAGVTVTRLASDFNTSRATIRRVVGDDI